MKIVSAIILIILLLGGQSGFSQGFINLNFEAAKIIPAATGAPDIETTNALPGWTVLLGGSPQAQITYNAPAVGSTWVCLITTNMGLGSWSPASGNYSVLLQGGTYPFQPLTATISQTGLVPVSAVSLLFAAQPGPGALDVSFGGQSLNFSAISTGPNYTLFGADISAFAGQTGALGFSALLDIDQSNNWNIDNIQFSSSPVPEPSVLALSGLGGLLLACRRWKHTSQ